MARAARVRWPRRSSGVAHVAHSSSPVRRSQTVPPSRLRDTVLPHEVLPEIARTAFEEATGVSPRPLDGPETLRSLLDEMW